MRSLLAKPLILGALAATGVVAVAGVRFTEARAAAHVRSAEIPGDVLGAAITLGDQAGDQLGDQLGDQDDSLEPHAFYFTRAVYTGGGRGRGYGFWGGRGGNSWRTDAPKADLQFLTVLGRLTGVDAYQAFHPVALDDPNLRHFPFIYAVEVGHMALTDSEVKGLRDYLLAGGFLVVDDFWGTYEWRNFEENIKRVLPEYPIVEIPLDHPIYHAFYDIPEIIQVPNVGNGERGGPTYEQDGYVPHCRGIFDSNGRLMVVINWNTDLGDGWEWAEQAAYPLTYSTYAYRMGANFIVYAMSH